MTSSGRDVVLVEVRNCGQAFGIPVACTVPRFLVMSCGPSVGGVQLVAGHRNAFEGIDAE